MWKESTARMPAILLALLWPDPAPCAPFPTQAHVAARYLQRWLDRLEHRVVEARQQGTVSAEQYRALQERVKAVGMLREEALIDGLVSTRERESIHRAIGEINMDLAEARVKQLHGTPPDRKPAAAHVPRQSIRPARALPAASTGSAQ